MAKDSLFGDQDCERPACDDIKQALPKSMEDLQAMAKKHQAKKKVECPPRSAEIGRSTWKLLHTMAAWYPDKPTNEDKEQMSSFFLALGTFYPCIWCAKDFQQELKKTPPATESREDLCMWLCDQHNRVNKKLGKPLFNCTMPNLDERWRISSNPKCKSDH
eukprot:Nitzschia sp. Nitz4//scaffold29_size155292//67567//68205//NITZ4_002657-RA/size155292-processed-gene-0.46-mRNA-1//-1//CDS//3329546445//3705//frame0